MVKGKGKSEKPSGHKLSGKISDRIRKGQIDADPLAPRVEGSDAAATAAALRAAQGLGLGKGATRGRNGGAS